MCLFGKKSTSLLSHLDTVIFLQVLNTCALQVIRSYLRKLQEEEVHGVPVDIDHEHIGELDLQSEGFLSQIYLK